MRFIRGRIEFRVRKIPPPFPEPVLAVTVWPIIVYETQVWDDKCVQLHERYHWIDQLRWLILPWFAVYAVLSLRYRGGRQHPLERAAYRLEDSCREAS
jgi:hypothetical protein